MTNQIFVLSSIRSGSTLTRFIIDTHPDIYSPAEVNIGDLAADLYTTLTRLEGTSNKPLEENRDILARIRVVLSDILDSHTRRKRKKIWCEKSPGNARHRNILAEIFPEARFVCLHRHALGVAHSCLATYRFSMTPLLQEYILRTPCDIVHAILSYWVDTTAGLLEFERNRPERTFRVRYEDIVREPAGTLAPMFRFFGVGWDPDLLDSVFSLDHDPGGDASVLFSDRIHQASVGVGWGIPTSQLPTDLTELLHALLHELGYAEKPEPPRATAADSREQGARWVFETLLPARASAGALTTAPFAVNIVVHGEGGGTWGLKWDGTTLGVSPELRGLSARIEIEAMDLLAIVQGQTNAARIAREGRIRGQGMTDMKVIRDLVSMMRSDLPVPKSEAVQVGG